MKSCVFSKGRLSILLLFPFGLAGCFSTNDGKVKRDPANAAVQGTTEESDAGDAAEAAQASKSNVIVEAFLEYPTAHSKWAPPAPTLVHIETKDAAGAKVEVTPEIGPTARLRAQMDQTPDNRKPTSIAAPIVETQVARAKLETLASKLKASPVGPGPCLYPIRARFVYSGGNIAEFTGCRGNTRFSKVFSAAVSEWVEAGN